MVTQELKSGVSWVGAVDFDRRMFDELIPHQHREVVDRTLQLIKKAGYS